MHIHYLIWFFGNRAREADYLLFLEIVGVAYRASGVSYALYRVFGVEMGKLDVLLSLAYVLDHFELDCYLPIIGRT